MSALSHARCTERGVIVVGDEPGLTEVVIGESVAAATLTEAALNNNNNKTKLKKVTL